MNRILIVEDDRTIAMVMRTVLSRGGWEIRHSVDGQDAVQVAAEWNPALILLDVELPSMNGFDVCSTVRATEQGETPLIVMVTASDDLPSKLMGFQVGADDYLIKPVDPQELLTRVTKLLGVREAQARTIKQRRRDAMNELIATICHEVNNPLTAVIGYLDMIVDDKELPPKLRRVIDGCRLDVLRVMDVVQCLKKVEDRVVPYIGDTTMIDLSKGAGAGGTGLTARLDILSDSFNLRPDPQQIPAPDLADLFLRVAPPHQFQRDVEGLGGVVPAVDAAAAVEVGRNADVVDPDQLHGVVDVIDEIPDRGAGWSGVLRHDRAETAIVGRALCRKERRHCGGRACGGGHSAVDRARARLGRNGRRCGDAELRPQRGQRRLSFARALRRLRLDVAVKRHHLDHATVLLQGQKLFIVHVAAVIGEGTDGGMRRDDRRP